MVLQFGIATFPAPAGMAMLQASAGTALAGTPYTATFANFTPAGGQATRFDTDGDALDAHDGEIAFFDGLYYLYGTSYACGFEWQNPGGRFCGFKAYSSPDLVHWTPRGFLFDAVTDAWQKSCDGNSYGCYRPHVLYNQATRKYVLWINVYDNRAGFRVFTSGSPWGPFTETAQPTLAVNNDAPLAGVNNGDHDTFLDEDGTAWIAYTDWRTGGRIVIEKLDPSFLTGTGIHVAGVTSGATEAPSLFRRGSRYYVAYSDPNCGYCATGTSYRTAPSPLGPWTDGAKISDNSCGGQPAFVAPIPVANGTAYLYGSDLWHDRAKNEALANHFWGPLAFGADGSILKLECAPTVSLPLAIGSDGSRNLPADLDADAGETGFTSFCDLKQGIQRVQTFVPSRSGTLTEASFTTFKEGGPDSILSMRIRLANEAHQPIGPVLGVGRQEGQGIDWAPKAITWRFSMPVSAGVRYALVMQSGSTTGCYGMEYDDAAPSPYPAGGAAYSKDAGATFTVEKGRTLRFHTAVKGPTSGIRTRRVEPSGTRKALYGRRSPGTSDALGRSGIPSKRSAPLPGSGYLIAP
ncbi:MAG: hypothetical protein JWP91_298 [Fibrobacteres bacterium]|nr:hypothetical protein [Fibrobacterota bacterium]